MRFEEAYEGYRKRNLTQSEAALLLGVCDRTFRGYMNRYDAGGLDALVGKRLVQVSHRRTPVDEVMRLVEHTTAIVTWVGTPSTFTPGTVLTSAIAVIRGLESVTRKLD